MTPAPDAATEQSPWPTLALLLCMLLWVFAFTPTPIALATAPALLAFLAVVERAPSTKRAILIVGVFGAIAIGIGYSWLANTIQLFGRQSAPVSYLATALFGVVGVVHGWIFIVVHRAMRRRGVRPHPMQIVILFCAVESIPYIRFFPWMVGHGAVDNPPLLQSAEWGGVPGVSFALLCLIVPFHEWIQWAFGRERERTRPRAALVTFCVGLALYGWGMWRYGDVNEEVAATSRTLRVGMVQANIGSLDKQAAEKGVRDMQGLERAAYEAGTRKALAQDVELVVWPETAVTLPVPFGRGARQVDGYLSQHKYRFIRETLGDKAGLLAGMYEAYDTRRREGWNQGRGVDRYNTAALRQPGGMDAGWSTVRKVYLIPFGEFMPFGLPDSLLPQNFKMRAGETGQEPLTFKDLRLVPFLCYEGILPGYVRQACAGEAPDVLVSLTNDSWFGDTWEPWQHLNFTRFRAVEHRAPLVRATNTGVSAFVSPSGDVLAQTALGLTVESLGEPDVLVHDVRLRGQGRTLYARFGHMLPFLFWVLALLGLMGALMKPPPVLSS